MISEIHNKISQTGSNLSDRLEDKLTGDFFGTLRYLPFELGLKHVLKTAAFDHNQIKQNWFDFIESQLGYEAKIEFWPKDTEGEIDLLISSDEFVVGVEVKYLSGISSEDSNDQILVDFNTSVNQLARYSRMLENNSRGRKPFLLFLAPYLMMNSVKNTLINRPIISPAVNLGFMCWEDILESLITVDKSQYDIGQMIIVNDLKALLTKKGFVRFNGFGKNSANISIIKEKYYQFILKDSPNNNSWVWPTNTVKEDIYYDFKHN